MKCFFLFFLLIFSCQTQANQAIKNIRNSLSEGVVSVDVDNIKPGPFEGLYTLHLKGGKVLYATPDGKYFFHGEIYEVESEPRRIVNLTREQEAKGIRQEIAKIPDSKAIVFPASVETSEVTVFTDSSCPFCQKFHDEVKDLNRAGITVRYLAYPREGLDSDTYKTMVAVWCSEDRKAALNHAIEGGVVERKECNNPVSQQYELGRQIGIKGTPTVVFKDGRTLSGYRDAKFIIKATGK